nr:hypothetical protein [Corynebacterium lactis]
MSIAMWMLGTSLAAAALAHAPFRGRSFRDALRRSEGGTHIGLRLTPGVSERLDGPDIVDLVQDAPWPITSMRFYEVAPEPMGADGQRWTHVVATLRSRPHGEGKEADTLATRNTVDFLRHRLALLGLRPRVLTSDELDATLRCSATVSLSESGNHNDFVRSPHLWFTGRRCVVVVRPPAQLLGMGEKDHAVTMRLGAVPRLRVESALGRDELGALLLPALELGYRIGIRTGRPQLFSHVLDAGAILVPSCGDESLDCIMVDGDCGHVETHDARIVELWHPEERPPYAPATVLPKGAATVPTRVPTLSMREFVWSLRTAHSEVLIQPAKTRQFRATATAYSEGPDSLPAQLAPPAPMAPPARRSLRGRAADYFPEPY